MAVVGWLNAVHMKGAISPAQDFSYRLMQSEPTTFIIAVMMGRITGIAMEAIEFWKCLYNESGCSLRIHGQFVMPMDDEILEGTFPHRIFGGKCLEPRVTGF